MLGPSLIRMISFAILFVLACDKFFAVNSYERTLKLFLYHDEHISCKNCERLPGLSFVITKDARLEELNIPVDENIKTLYVYHSELGSKTSIKPIYYHDYIVLSTGDDYNNSTLWWSVEKNDEEILVQLSPSLSVVSEFCYGQRRTSFYRDNQAYEGKRTIGDLFKVSRFAVNLPYNFLTENCRDFTRQIFTLFTLEGMDRYEFKTNMRLLIYFFTFSLFYFGYINIAAILGTLMGIYVITEIVLARFSLY